MKNFQTILFEILEDEPLVPLVDEEDAKELKITQEDIEKTRIELGLK